MTVGKLPSFYYISDMNSPATPDVFEISLSQEGASYLLRTFRLVRWVFLFASIASAAYLYLEIARYTAFKEFGSGHGWNNLLVFRVMPWVAVAITLLNITQFATYMIFTRFCYRAIEWRQPDLFNESFKWLLRNTRMALVVMLLNLFSVAFYIVEHIKTVAER